MHPWGCSGTLQEGPWGAARAASAPRRLLLPKANQNQSHNSEEAPQQTPGGHLERSLCSVRHRHHATQRKSTAASQKGLRQTSGAGVIWLVTRVSVLNTGDARCGPLRPCSPAVQGSLEHEATCDPTGCSSLAWLPPWLAWLHALTMHESCVARARAASNVRREGPQLQIQAQASACQIRQGRVSVGQHAVCTAGARNGAAGGLPDKSMAEHAHAARHCASRPAVCRLAVHADCCERARAARSTAHASISWRRAGRGGGRLPKDSPQRCTGRARAWSSWLPARTSCVDERALAHGAPPPPPPPPLPPPSTPCARISWWHSSSNECASRPPPASCACASSAAQSSAAGRSGAGCGGDRRSTPGEPPGESPGA
jgi:hypothetical protein